MRIRRHADACDGSMSDAQALRAPVPPRKCSHRYSRIDSYSDVRTSRELWTGSTSHCMRISRSVIRKQFPVNRHCILTQDLALTCWTRRCRRSSQWVPTDPQGSQLLAGNYSIKRRRHLAFPLAYTAMYANKANVDRIFGVHDWRVLIHDSLHNSDGRPKARGRKEGDHWTAWAFDLKSKRSIFYLHMYEDGRVARFGADKRKAFRVKKYDLIWSGEVTAK